MEIMRSVTGYDTVLVDLKEEDRDLHQMMDELEDSDDEADANTETRPEIPTPTEREEAAEAAANAAPQKEEWEGAEEEAAHSEYREFIEESDCEITDDEDSDYTPHPEEDTESDSDSDSEMTEIDTVTPSDQASPSTSTARTRSAKAPPHNGESYSLRRHFRLLTGYDLKAYADIIVFHGASIDISKPIPRHIRAELDMELIDFTYAGERPENLLQSFAKKNTTYMPVCSALVNQLGFKSAKVVPIVAGVRGWNPVMCKTALSQQLHITPARTNKVMNALTTIAWNAIRTIVGARRQAEASPEHYLKSGVYAMKRAKIEGKHYQGDKPTPTSTSNAAAAASRNNT